MSFTGWIWSTRPDERVLDMNTKKLAVIIPALGGVAMAEELIRAAAGSDVEDPLPELLFVIGVFLWAVLPFVALVILMLQAIKRVGSVWLISLFGSLLITGATIWLLVDLQVHPDAQNGLAFVFAPFFLWLGVAVLAILTVVVWKWRQRNARPAGEVR